MIEISKWFQCSKRSKKRYFKHLYCEIAIRLYDVWSADQNLCYHGIVKYIKDVRINGVVALKPIRIHSNIYVHIGNTYKKRSSKCLNLLPLPLAIYYRIAEFYKVFNPLKIKKKYFYIFIIKTFLNVKKNNINLHNCECASR